MQKRRCSKLHKRRKQREPASPAADLTRSGTELAEAAQSKRRRGHKQATRRQFRREGRAKRFRSTIVERSFRGRRQAPNGLPSRAAGQSSARGVSWPHSRTRSKECWPRQQVKEARRCERGFHCSGRRVLAISLPRVT